MKPLTIAFTADLHWGVRDAGDDATRQLVAELQQRPADVLVIAGDIGAGADFERCLEQFDEVPGIKALVPGNHDVWVQAEDERGDSWRVYDKRLPKVCEWHKFHYLDRGPLILPEAGLALVGSMNWYDYSWAAEPGWEPPADWEERLRNKRFTRGRHNDGRFVRWDFTDVTFTQFAVENFEKDLDEALTQVEQVIAVTHHPAFVGINFPESGPVSLDRMLWRAFSGNKSIEQVLLQHAGKIPWTFSGHTHRVAAGALGPIRGRNIGGDYEWKRLLRLSWPDGKLEALEFPPQK